MVKTAYGPCEGSNEKLTNSDCYEVCSAKTCAKVLNVKVACRDKCLQGTVCDCAPGFARNKAWKCIPEAECTADDTKY